MKIFEREEMLIEHGRDLERKNTKKAEEKAEEAAQRTKATSILELLQEYDTVPDWLINKIMEEQSMTVLREWLKIFAKANSIEKFLERTNITE